MKRFAWILLCFVVTPFFLVAMLISWLFEFLARLLGGALAVVSLAMERAQHRVHNIEPGTFMNCPFETSYAEAFFNTFDSHLR